MNQFLLITVLALSPALCFADWAVVQRDYFSPGL
jgi:hypothetical protein